MDYHSEAGGQILFHKPILPSYFQDHLLLSFSFVLLRARPLEGAPLRCRLAASVSIHSGAAGAAAPRPNRARQPGLKVSTLTIFFNIDLYKALVAQMVESACNPGDMVRSLGWEDSLGEGNGNLLQYSCLENSTDRGSW